MSSDGKIFDIAVAGIRRAAMGPDKWVHTRIAELHPSFSDEFKADLEELVIASGFRSASSWYVFTTRRIVGCRNGNVTAIDPRRGITSHWGNFKGYAAGVNVGAGTIPFEIARISQTDTGCSVEFDFETGRASMAPIYAARYWQKVKARLRGNSHLT